jgi:hypothetical protein
MDPCNDIKAMLARLRVLNLFETDPDARRQYVAARAQLSELIARLCERRKQSTSTAIYLASDGPAGVDTAAAPTRERYATGLPSAKLRLVERQERP